MKKMLCFIISMLIALSFSISTNAVTFDDTVILTLTGSEFDLFCDDFYYHILNDDTAEITSYIGTNEDLYIPDTLADHIVTAIDIQSKNSNVLNIYLGKHISSFYCTTDSPLENVYVDNQNKFLSSSQGILYSADMTELLYIPSMSKITDLTIQDSVIKVSALPFSKSMRNLTIGKNVIQTAELNYNLTSVVYYAQMENIFVESGNPYYRSINGIVYWYDTESEIDRYAFPPSNKTTSFKVPDGQKYLGRNELQYCKYLEDLYLPNGLEIVGYEFNNIESLKNIFVNDDNKVYCSIDGVLYNKDITEMLCYPWGNMMTDYHIPDTVVTLKGELGGTWSLRNGQGTKHLKNIYVPKSVTEFGNYSFTLFGDCIENIIVDKNNTVYHSENGIMYKDTKVSAYPQNNRTKDFHIPEGTNGVTGNSYLNGCRYVENVYVPSSLINFNFGLFEFNENLKNIYVDASNPAICDIDGILYNKEKTRLLCYPRGRECAEVVLPNGTEELDNCSFYKCNQITGIVVPASMKELNGSAFIQCENLCDFTFTKDIQSISGIGYVLGGGPGAGGWKIGNIENVTIRGYSGTVAESYARDNGFTFISLGKVDRLLGDADGDDSVTILDATVIQRHLASIPTAVYIEAAADADQDGSVTIIDATAIQRWLVQLPSNENIGKLIV